MKRCSSPNQRYYINLQNCFTPFKRSKINEQIFVHTEQKGRVGTVLTHPDVTTTVVGQHQYGEQAYGQPPAYDQTQYSQPSSFAQPGPDPAYPPTEP